jgi:hypothetical protein
MKYIYLFISILATTIGLFNIHYYEIDAQEIHKNKNLGIKFTIPNEFEVSESDLNKLILSPKNMIDIFIIKYRLNY